MTIRYVWPNFLIFTEEVGKIHLKDERVGVEDKETDKEVGRRLFSLMKTMDNGCQVQRSVFR